MAARCRYSSSYVVNDQLSHFPVGKGHGGEQNDIPHRFLRTKNCNFDLTVSELFRLSHPSSSKQTNFGAETFPWDDFFLVIGAVGSRVGDWILKHGPGYLLQAERGDPRQTAQLIRSGIRNLVGSEKRVANFVASSAPERAQKSRAVSKLNGLKTNTLGNINQIPKP
jgi:hypothetical protein